MNDFAINKPSATEETGLATRDEFSTELAPTAAAAKEQYEIQGAMVLAKKFPRDEDQAFQKLMRACGRSSFAEDAEYSFPRGGQSVTGPSVNLAREAARIWTNIRYGVGITNETNSARQIQGWAYDLETNTKIVAEDSFLKLVFRKAKGWVEPDERDLRELTNRRAAILIRNCILQLLPKDLIEDALAASRETLRDRAAKDPDGERKRMLTAFSSINVTSEMLTAYLGHPVAQCSPTEIADLRAVYKSIADGNTTWSDYTNITDAESLKNKTQARAADLKEKLTPTVETKPDHIDESVTAPPPPDPDEPIDPLETLRANVNAQLDELTAANKKNVLAGKPFVKDMTEDELNALSVEIEGLGK